MYDVVTISSIKPEEVSVELNISLEHVKSYLSNYDLYKKYPIRDLTYEEIEFVKAIRQVKEMSDNDIKRILDENHLTLDDLAKDQLAVERVLSGFMNDSSYKITRKYQHFLIEPALLYRNLEAPLTKPLDMGNVLTLLSNMAVGLSDQLIGVKDEVKLKALSKIADIYTASKVLSLNTNEVITSEDLTDLSPKDLTRLINHVKTSKVEESKVEVNITQNPQELYLFD